MRLRNFACKAPPTLQNTVAALADSLALLRALERTSGMGPPSITYGMTCLMLLTGSMASLSKRSLRFARMTLEEPWEGRSRFQGFTMEEIKPSTFSPTKDCDFSNRSQQASALYQPRPFGSRRPAPSSRL